MENQFHYIVTSKPSFDHYLFNDTTRAQKQVFAQYGLMDGSNFKPFKQQILYKPSCKLLFLVSRPSN
jgi:hypothetical protein